MTALSYGFWSFVYTYIIRAGFMDGREGLMLAVSNAEGTYYRYLKLMLMKEKKMIRIAVIVTTYNRPDALSSALDGYCAQKDENFELVVADDGSADETAQVVAAYKRRPDLRLSHVWQKDEGFRAAAVRNRAIAETSADYIIFTDGDCIPLSDFVFQHRALAERGWFFCWEPYPVE